MTGKYKSMITLIGLSIPHKLNCTSHMNHILDMFVDRLKSHVLQN